MLRDVLFDDHNFKPKLFLVLQQTEYTGLIESCPADEQKGSGVEQGINGKDGTTDTFTVEYGITSLVDKKTLLQPGDRVNPTICYLFSFHIFFFLRC